MKNIFNLSVATIFLALLLAGCDEKTVQESKEPSTDTAAAGPPEPAPSNPPLNFLVIVADDLGYTDLGVFGSEISTPNIDELAKNGAVLTNYYSTPICAPTRSEILSGTDHHRAGEGMMQANIIGRPGYEGFLNHRVVTLATRLKDAGYHTYMAGKWHLGTKDDQIPSARGFERTFVLLDGGASHFGDQVGVLKNTRANYREDGKEVEQLPKDFYSSDFYTDKMISFLKTQEQDGKPFFGYLAYTAPHWPLQAPEEDVARQRGRYEEGYEVLRQRRFDAWKSLGYGSEDAEMPELPKNYVAWDTLGDEEKAKSIKAMEIYAAMVERLDSQIGRVLDYLRDSGQLDNTVILFQSDNGAEASSGHPGFTEGDNSLENMGQPGSWVYLGPGWAEAGSAPFYLNKSHTTEGGIHVPAILSAPGLGLPAGRQGSLIMTYDVAPTLLDLAGADQSAYDDREDILPISGRSFAALIRGEEYTNARGPETVVGREHAGHGAIRKGDWKLLWVGNSEFYDGVKQPGPPPMSGLPMQVERFDRGSPAGTPIGNGGPWKLFNLRDDPAERHDLSGTHPEIFKDLLREWDNYVAEYGVIVKSGEGDPGN